MVCIVLFVNALRGLVLVAGFVCLISVWVLFGVSDSGSCALILVRLVYWMIGWIVSVLRYDVCLFSCACCCLVGFYCLCLCVWFWFR